MDYSKVLLDENSTAEQRIQACFQLMVDGSDQAIDTLIHGLEHDSSSIVRHECAYSLGEVPSKRGKKALKHAITSDLNPFVKHEAALALSNLGHGKETIATLLDHPDENVVETARISLIRYDMKFNDLQVEGSPEDVLLDLEQLPEYRIQAAFNLLERNNEEAISTLLIGLEQEPNPIVKHEIIFCLGEVASSRVIGPLTHHMLEDPNPFVKHEAALALGTLGNDDVEDAIRSLLDHPNPDIVESAMIALERLTGPL